MKTNLGLKHIIAKSGTEHMCLKVKVMVLASISVEELSKNIAKDK